MSRALVSGNELFGKRQVGVGFAIRSFSLVRRFALEVQLGGSLEEILLGRFEFIACFKATIVDLRHILQIAVQPDCLGSTGQVGEQLRKDRFIEELARDASDEHGVGLGGLGVVGIDEMTLTSGDEMTHLLLNEVQNPGSEEEHEDDRSSISRLLCWSDVSERKAIQTVFSIGGASSVEGEEEGPREEPNRQEEYNHHSEEPDEEISVHPIGTLDVLVIESPESGRPS